MKKLQIFFILILFLLIGIVSGCYNQNQSQDSKNNEPTVTISTNSITGLRPLNISFIGLGNDSDGVITSYYWTFGDGNISDEQNPTHRFDLEGSYIVNLRVTDNDNATAEDSIIITVYGVNLTLNPTDDASFYSGMGRAVGDSDYLSVELFDKKVLTISALKFNLSSIPSDRSIERATLRLYCWDIPYNTSIVKIHQSNNSSWAEDDTLLSWGSRPLYLSNFSAEVAVTSYGWYEWDITDYVQNALILHKITLILDTDSTSGLISFYSKESSTNPPQLLIILEETIKEV